MKPIQPRRLLRALFDAAVTAADPMVRLPAALPSRPETPPLIVGAGKASARMAEALESAWGPCEGLVVTRYGYGRPTSGIEIVEAGHPEPDAAGLAATARLCALVEDAPADRLIVALISGGGSALLTRPRPPATLADKQALTRDLLASGAPIDVMNAIRSQLSLVKGGRLAALAKGRMLTLTISDVPGDDPAMIASGPTVQGPAIPAPALDMLAEWRVQPNEAVRAALAAAEPAPSLDAARFETRIVAAPSQSLAAAASLAEADGVEPRILGDALEGEARALAAAQATEAMLIQSRMGAGDRPVLLLSGGECTVTRTGDGIGGPNAEFALAFATVVDGRSGLTAIACDTDGVDGAAEVAGAIADGATASRARSAGVDPLSALARNDSHGFFASLGDQVVPGPTLTNVNDFRAILIEPVGV